MRILSLVSVSSLALAASLSFANAQATNVDRQGGMAPTIGNTYDSMSRSTIGRADYNTMGGRMNGNATGYDAMNSDISGRRGSWQPRQERTQRNGMGN
jgi:hypothetical protein